MTAAVRDTVVSMVLAGSVLFAVMFALRVIRYVRLYRPLANRRFKRRYRAKRSLHSRTTRGANETGPAVSRNPVRALPGAHAAAGTTACPTSDEWSTIFARSAASGPGVPVGGDALRPSVSPPTPWQNGFRLASTGGPCAAKHRALVPPPSVSRRLR